MDDITFRMGWYFALTASFGLVCYLLFGSIFEVRTADPVIIRDSLKPGEHFVSGIITVPSPCHQISVDDTKALDSATYLISLRSWEEPSAKCAKEPTPRSFDAIIFAPAFGVQFIVQLDGAVQDVQYISVLAKPSS